MSERYTITDDGQVISVNGPGDQVQPWDQVVAYALRQCLADLAERDALIADYRDEFSGLCHTLSVGSEGRPEMTSSDWRKRVDQGIEFLIRPLQERAERAEAELALAREHIARSDEHHQAAAIAMTENLRAEVIRLASKIVQLQKESK